MARQFLRKCVVSLSGSSSATIQGGGPTDLKVDFSIGTSTLQTPDSARVRISNPNPQTIAAFKNQEFKLLEVQAGYEDNCATIYKGDVRQGLYAHEEDNVTSYIDIIAATAGNAYQMSHVNKSLAAGWKPQDKVQLALDAMAPHGVTGLGLVNVDLSQPARPRGRAVVGMARDILREVALSTGAVWWIDRGGKVNMVDHTKPLQGDGPVVLNSATGLIGWPQATESGIIARVLINPSIVVGTTVKIDQASINPAERDNTQAGGFGTIGSKNQALDMAGQIAADGLYRVAFMETEGSTRSQPWYMTLTCIALGGSLNPEQTQSYIGPDLMLGQH